MSGDAFSYAVHNSKNGGDKISERINLKITKEDYCGYTGECREYLNVFSGLCYFCMHKRAFDIPLLVEEYRRRNDSSG